MILAVMADGVIFLKEQQLPALMLPSYSGVIFNI